MIEKGPGFKQILDPIGDTAPKYEKGPGFGLVRTLPAPLEQVAPSEDYSKDYQAGEPLNNYLSRSQGAWDEFGNLLAQTGIEALAGSVEAASYLGDWQQIASKFQGEESEYSNWLAESMKSLKEQGKTNWAPIYTNEENKGFNPSSFEWWAANGGQGLGSTLSLLIPGIAVSKIAKLAGLAELGQAVSAGLASRYAESTMEANQVYQDAISQGATPEKAGEAASKTWNTNWIFAIQDIAAFSQISKGTQALSKGVKGKGFLSWMGELGTQMATEGAEEAGQYVVSEEAKKTALNANIDYFGEGFNKRLSDYIHDDEFKTSTLLGAMGGGVFHAAGSVLDKVTDVEQGTSIKDRIQSLFGRGVQKEVANSMDDKITSQKIDQITLAQSFTDALNNDKLNQHKAYLEEQKNNPETTPEAKQLITKHLADVEDLLTLQSTLRNNPSIPEELHKPILQKKLELNQANYLLKQTEQEQNKTFQELQSNEQLDPQFISLKKAHATMQAYSRLKYHTDQLGGDTNINQKAEQAAINYAQEREAVKQQLPNLDIDRTVKTDQDDKLIRLATQHTSLAEQRESLKQELDNLYTPQGVTAYKQAIINKQINNEAKSILSKPNVTKEELLQAEKNATDPELKTAIAKKYQELVDKDRQDNLDQLGDIHEPDQSTMPVDDITPDDTVLPQEADPNDEDINPYDNLTPDALGEFSPDDLEQRKKFGLTVEETKEIISGIDVETRQPKSKESTVKEEEIQAVESIKGKTTVSTTSLDKNSKGNPVEYISRYTGRKAKANEIIAVDPVTGQLLKNTPRVTIGQQVTLKLEKDYEWDQRNKPTYNEDNYTIAIYLEGVQKPIDFLRSADNKYMSQAEKDHNKALRKQIYDSPTQSIVTTIVDKNIGTPRLDETQKDITILEFDFALDQDGRWRMQRTNHNPILFNVDHLGNIKVPNTGSMNGIDQSTLDRVQHSVETYFTKSDLKKMAGQTGVFRTAPDTSFRAIALDYRLLNEQEKGWVKTSLSKLIKDKDFNTLSEVIYVPIQTGGIYNNTGDNNRAKVPDLFKKEKGKFVMDRKRFHISSSSFKTELLIPTTATKKNSEPVWISVEDKQLDNFLSGKDFTYKILTYEEGSVRTSDAKTIEPQKIRDVFDKMLDQQFKNLNADNINSERQYTDPVNGEVHPSFYDYLLKTQTVTTKLKGSKTLGVGEDSSYSFNQVSLYLDPNPSQTKITVDEEGLIHVIEDEVPQETSKEDKELTDEELRRLFEEDAHLKPYTTEGYTYSLMGEEELNWFKNNIGEEFLEVAKNVDRFLSTNGVEAFGQYYNSLVTLAQLAPEGTAYHEAFHFMFDPNNGLITNKEKERLLENTTEEKLAEDFERYQLSNGKTKPKVERAKGFFRRLLQMIKSLLGLRSPLEKLFAKFDQGLTLEQRDRILANKGLNTNDEVKLKRLPGFFSGKHQKAAVGTFASEVMRLANEAAQRNNIHVFDFLSKKENVDSIFSQVKANFTRDYNRILESGSTKKTDRFRYLSYLAMGLGHSILKLEQQNNGTYEDTQQEGLNPVDGFKTTVLRELTNWGFRVRIDTKTEERKQLDDDAQEDLEDRDDETSERVFGKDSVELDPTDSLSARMRSFLSTIPEAETDEWFGIPKFINFKKVDASLKMKLADSITPLVKLEQLAQKDPVIDSVLKALESERAKGNTQLYTEFFMKYKLDTQIEKTAIEETVEQWIPFSERTQSEIDRGIDKRRVSKIKLIDTDRTSADKSLINRWREEAVVKRLIDTHGEVKLDLVKPIQEEFDKFKTKFFEAKDKRNNLPYKDVKDTFVQTLTKLGITIPEEVWVEQERRKDPYNELHRWMFGDRSLDSMLSRLMDGKSPYSESSSGLLADIARKSAPYIGDLGRGAYRSDDGKQKFSINLPSYITEFFNQAKQDTAGLLDRFKNDPRYAKNAFLGVIRDNNHRTKIGVTFSSAIRQGDKDPKAFDDRTEIESILYRLTAYHNNAGNYALINVGTPADKGKQPMAILPKERKALDFLRTVLINNVDYEVLRITSLREYTGLREALQSKIDSQQELTPEEQRLNRHIQANPLPTDIKNLKDSTRFKYIPALDSIPNLTASVSKGDISAQQYLDARKQVAVAIDKFIENEYQSFLKFLDSNDIISTKQNKDGLLEFNENIRISEGVLTTMVKGKEVQSGSFEAFLKEFFYNDLGWRLEMSKVFQGDLALYSNQDDYYKRQYQLVTPGYKPQTRLSTKSTVTRLVYAKQFKRSTIDELLNIAQMIRPSVTKTQVEKIVEQHEAWKENKNNPPVTDPLFKSIVLKYEDINKTDAQSLMSIHAHKSIAEAVGQWTKEHEQVYQFAWKDDVTVAKAISDKRKNNSITEEEATNIRIMTGKILMQPFKPFLIRDVEVKLPNGQVMMIKEQVKDSVTVITPELANTSLGYRDLLAYMKEHKVDIASAEDTVKVGSYGVINLNDNDSSKWPVPAEWQKRVTSIEDIRFPQFISDDKKEEISGTQAHKLVVANIDDKASYTIDDKEKTGKWVKEQYNELWAEKIIESAKELRTKLGLSSDSLKLSTDPDKRNKQIYKLWELLKQELSEREINENYKDVIELEKKINGTVDFTIPISFPAFGPKFQSILTNLWKKNVLKQESAGYSAINMADWGVNYSDELKFVTNSAGDVIEAEIGLPIDYVNDIGLEYGTHINRLNGVILMDKLNENQKKALQFILYRIPTSNKSSMIPVRVARITPKHLNNVVIIPGELTIQQGLDFDVDKSQLLRRVLADGKIDKENTDTKIFDLYWGVLTNKAHTEEMITPLASPTLEAKQEQFKTKGILENVEATSPFSPQSDISAEIRNKDGKAEIGIASRYNTGHAVLQMIKDYVSVQASIGIEYNGNSFSSIGDKNAVDGSLISTNHGESQQAALDAAKNPLLAYFNVVKGTMAGFHTMIEFGIPIGIVVDFYMQPVVREWTKFYKHEEQSKDRATDKLFTRYAGIKAQYDLLQGSLKPLTSESLEKGLEDGLTDTQRSARVLYEFLNVLNIAEQMTSINNVLSVDTFKDATSLESLQAFLEQLKNATDRSKPVYVDKRIFNLETTPTEGKRLAAFFKYGVQDAIDYISQFYPSTSEVYQEVRDTYADITKQSLTNKNLLKKINQFTDYFMLQGDSSLFSLLTKDHPLYNVDPKLDKSDYRLRWSFFDPNRSLYDLIQKMVRAKDKDSLKYPTLSNNEFIKGLISEESRTNQVQVFGVRNTDANQDKTDYINGWYALMQSNDPDIRTLAHDLVRYSIQTSGFNYSTRSFYDLIPVQYLIESGVASLWEQLSKAPQVEVESNLVNFIRHNFRSLNRFPTLYGKTVKGVFRSDNILDVKMKENRMEGFTLKSSFLKDEELPRFYRINDYNLGEYRLYESNPSNIREFREAAPLGGKNWVEVSPDRIASQHSEIRSQKVGTPDPWNTKQFNLEGSTGIGTNEFLKKYLPEDTNKAKTVLEALLANEVDIEAKKGLEVLLRNVDKINTPAEIGYVTPGNLATFRITKNAVTSDITTKIVVNSSANLESDSDLRYVLHHELTHAYGTGVLHKPEGELQINYVRNINRVFEDAKKRSDLQDEYGLTSIYEFHAELASNKEFRKKLRGTDLWSRILRAIRKLLGLKDTYDKVLDQYYTILDQVEELQKINPGEFALKIEEKKKAVKKQNPIEQMHSNLKARIKRLKGQGKNISAEDLKLKFEKLQKMEEAQQMVEYILLVDDEMKSVKTLYKSLATTPDKINPDILQPLVEQLTSYKLLGSYNRQIARNPKQFEGIIHDKEVFDKNLSDLIRDVSRMTESVNKLALIRSAHIIKQTSSDPNLTIEKIEEELEVADRDITILSRLGDVGRELRDKTLSTLYTLISKVNSAAWRRTQEDLYSTETKKVDTKIDILIPNSNNPNFHWEQRSLKFNKTGKFKALQEYEKWLGKVDTFADKFAPVIDQNSKSKNDNGIQFISPWSKRGQEIKSIAEGSKDYPLRQFYETFVLDYLASQNNIPYKGLRPGLRVPSIQKSIMETLMEKGVGNKLQSIGEQALNNFRRRYDEADYYAVDENGDRQEYIPTRYVSKQDGQNGRMNTDQVSLDIATTLTVFSNEMYSREGMEKIVSDLELMKHTVKNRQVLTNTKLLDTPGISSFLTAEREGNELESGEYEKKEGVESEAYKAFDAGMRQQVYGQLKKEEGAFKVGKNKFSVSKMSDALLKYSGFNILFGNIAIPLTNIIVGKVGTIREAVGGNIINIKNAMAGEKLFAKEGFTSIKDFGRREKVSKLGRVFTYFNPYDHANVRGLGTDSNYAKAIFDKVITTGGAVAEFEIGVSTMGAVMDKFKAQKEGKDVSFYEAIDMDKNGKVKLNNGYTYKGKKEVSEEDIDEIKDYTLRLYQNIYGVNNKIDKAQSNEYAIGRLVGFMRGWFLSGVNTKWRTRFYDERLKMDQEGHYLSTIIAFNNVFTGEDGFIPKMVDTLRILTWQSTNNPELLLHPTELEYSDERKQELINLRKANIRKTMFELYMIVGLYTLLALGWDDDDNDSYVKYLAARVKRELSTFYSPSTAFDVLRSPTVMFNTIDGFSKIIYDANNSIAAMILDEDQPVYQRGPGKDQNKLWFDVKKQLGVNSLTQFTDLETKTRLAREGRPR